MSLFPTSLLLEALAAESPGHTAPSPTDSSAHMPSASDIHDVPSAFRWIIANHYTTQPASPPRSVRIVADKGTCSESECAPHENVVTVHESKVTFWYRPYSEPGAPRFAGYRLHGLFDFMRAVIWERLIDERKIDRFLLEPGLVGEEKAAVDHYQALREEAARLADADIQQIKVLDTLATRWYALQFERICLSDDVLDLGRRLFFTESDESEPAYRARVSSECKPKAAR